MNGCSKRTNAILIEEIKSLCSTSPSALHSPSPSYLYRHHQALRARKEHTKLYFLLCLNWLPPTQSKLELCVLSLEQERKLKRMISVYFTFNRQQQFSFLEPKSDDRIKYITKINQLSCHPLTTYIPTHTTNMPRGLQYNFTKLVVLLANGQPDAWHV